MSDGHTETPHRGIITVSVMLAAVMQSLDNTIANVALPHIQGSLSSTQEQMSWVLTSYIVATAIMIPLSGWLAGKLGRRRVFIASIIGFTVSSALCGLAQTLPEIVFARILQGACGAALVPLSQASLLDINPVHRHAKAMSVWALGVTVGPILGPALGGWLTEHYSWRWVFFINVPFGILCFLGVAGFLPESQKRDTRFDFFGFASLSLAVGCFQLMLDRGQTLDWFSSLEIRIEAAVAALALYLFIVHVKTTRQAPFISLSLFRDRNFLAGNLLIFIVGVVLLATLALTPPLLQGLLGYPVLLTGMVSAPRGIGSLVAMVIVGRLTGRVDPRLLVATGFVLTAISLWMMTGFYLQMDASLTIWSGFIQGVGTGFVYVPLAAITFATLLPHLRNEGTSVFSLVRNIGSSLGISAVTALLSRNTQIMHSRLAEHITPYDSTLHGALASVDGLARMDAQVNLQAAMIAYNNDFQLMTILTLCALPLVWILRRPTPAKTGQAVAKEVVVME